jgi:pimeloyl-ACP methyl ester carboxylesterase
MPFVGVPVRPGDSQSAAPPVRIAYTLCGHGPRLVALIPGLCTPASMYNEMSAHLGALHAAEYTTVAIDNRGIGESDAPPLAASVRDALCGRVAYSPDVLARDAWAVIDAVRRGGRPEGGAGGGGGEFCGEVGLVGHSMGGMIAQRMVVLRPRAVRFCALMSSHAGGLWNLVPTPVALLAMLRAAVNRFDAGVVALANLDLHFTRPFLEQLVSRDPYSRQRRSALLALATEGKRRLSALSLAQTPGVVKRRKRRDVYFARYMQRDFDWATGVGRRGEREEPGPPSLQHLAVVLQHRLTRAEQRALRACARVHAIVIAGADDQVVTPLSSRSLARGIGAAAYVEVPGAHMVFDERAAHVNALVALGLRSAFRGDQGEGGGGGAARDGAATAGDDAFGGEDGSTCGCDWCSGGGGPAAVGDGEDGNVRASWFWRGSATVRSLAPGMGLLRRRPRT